MYLPISHPQLENSLKAISVAFKPLVPFMRDLDLHSRN